MSTLEYAAVISYVVIMTAVFVWLLIPAKPIKQPEPIAYPELPEDKMYLDIVTEIKKASNDSDLYAAYQNILIFEAEYGKTNAGLVSALYEMYEQKEIMPRVNYVIHCH